MDGHPDLVLLDGGARLIGFASCSDSRGRLTPVQFPIAGLVPARFFVVEGAPGAVRGGHGHRTGRQLLWAVAGEVTVDLCTHTCADSVTLRPGGPTLLVEPGTWAAQTYGAAGGVLLVLCDTPYDRADYFPDRPGGGGPP